MRRTRIVATVGPACEKVDTLSALIRAGVNVFRLNFSHGTHESHAAAIARIRTAAQQTGLPVAILQDLQGPKIRTGKLVDGQPVTLVQGDRFVITTEPIVGTRERVSTTYTPLPQDVKPGDRILLDDGYLSLKVVEIRGVEVICEVTDGGTLGEKKGINLPGVQLSTAALTDKDKADAQFGVQQGVDFIALSFVRRAEDVNDLRSFLLREGASIPIIAKIERPEAIACLDSILARADGVMVARGDLGVEMPVEELPVHQKRIIRDANLLGRLVITATQMLDSMIRNPLPTRAEVTDVANAILDGTDAVMLSGETASGAFPEESVKMMARIAANVEESVYPFYRALSREVTTRQPFTEAAVDAACFASYELRASALVAFTHSGNTARILAAQRPRCPVVAFTARQETMRRLCMCWGIIPILLDRYLPPGEAFQHAEAELVRRGICKHGDSFVSVMGSTTALGAANLVKIQRVGESE